MTAVGCDGVYANKYDGRKWSWFNTEEDLEGRSLWLPTLSDSLDIIQQRWPLMDMTTYPEGEWTDDSTAHIMAASKCVDWCPTSGSFWRCNECGDTLRDQPDGTQTYGPSPEEINDEVWDAWNGGANLPVCPHCGEARAKGLILAAATLAVRVLEGAKND